jgi:hypothetical protein
VSTYAQETEQLSKVFLIRSTCTFIVPDANHPNSILIVLRKILHLSLSADFGTKVCLHNREFSKYTIEMPNFGETELLPNISVASMPTGTKLEGVNRYSLRSKL